ncbi:hypothetical protein Acr_20g0006760 [Actinidia rufa]|uniref:Uncharacterized protein n=1 Tax=Actinidia rufa TaxID=165716 RepID=A0A7J0GDU2_9ERIC|nr:hypothetical protein Acr_20g0006760 [Actinidia rufa]
MEGSTNGRGTSTPVKQKLRRLRPEWMLKIKEEVIKQYNAGFLLSGQLREADLAVSTCCFEKVTGRQLRGKSLLSGGGKMECLLSGNLFFSCEELIIFGPVELTTFLIPICISLIHGLRSRHRSIRSEQQATASKPSSVGFPFPLPILTSVGFPVIGRSARTLTPIEEGRAVKETAKRGCLLSVSASLSEQNAGPHPEPRLQNASTMQLLQSQRDAPWSDDQDIGEYHI